jgi:transposase
VQAVLSGQLSQTQAATKFKIAGPATVGRWMKVFMSMERKGFAHLKLEKKVIKMIDDPEAVR